MEKLSHASIDTHQPHRMENITMTRRGALGGIVALMTTSASFKAHADEPTEPEKPAVSEFLQNLDQHLPTIEGIFIEHPEELRSIRSVVRAERLIDPSSTYEEIAEYVKGIADLTEADPAENITDGDIALAKMKKNKFYDSRGNVRTIASPIIKASVCGGARGNIETCLILKLTPKVRELSNIYKCNVTASDFRAIIRMAMTSPEFETELHTVIDALEATNAEDQMEAQKKLTTFVQKVISHIRTIKDISCFIPTEKNKKIEDKKE